MKSATFRADAILLLAAAIWGTGFVAQRAGMAYVGPMTFTALRLAIGALVLVPLICKRRSSSRRRNEASGAESGAGSTLRRGLLAGTVMFVAIGLQQIGLVHTTAGKAGFITGLYVVFVPMIGILVGQRINLATWCGAALATAGLYFLSVAGQIAINPGDLFVLASAVVWAGHVQVIGWLSPKTDSVRLAAMQFSTGAVLGLVAAMLTEEITFTRILACKWWILYGGVFPVAIAFTLQIKGQRDAPPAHAAILMSLETVFAAGTGWLVLGETLGNREFIGCALMLAGMLVSQMGRRNDPRGER